MALTLLEKAQVWLFKALMGALFAVIQLLSPRKPVVSRRQVSPVENPLLLVSATQLAKKIRRKEVRIRSQGQGRVTVREGQGSVSMVLALSTELIIIIIKKARPYFQ